MVRCPFCRRFSLQPVSQNRLFRIARCPECLRPLVLYRPAESERLQKYPLLSWLMVAALVGAICVQHWPSLALLEAGFLGVVAVLLGVSSVFTLRSRIGRLLFVVSGRAAVAGGLVGLAISAGILACAIYMFTSR